MGRERERTRYYINRMKNLDGVVMGNVIVDDGKSGLITGHYHRVQYRCIASSLSYYLNWQLIVLCVCVCVRACDYCCCDYVARSILRHVLPLHRPFPSLTLSPPLCVCMFISIHQLGVIINIRAVVVWCGVSYMHSH